MATRVIALSLRRPYHPWWIADVHHCWLNVPAGIYARELILAFILLTVYPCLYIRGTEKRVGECSMIEIDND